MAGGAWGRGAGFRQPGAKLNFRSAVSSRFDNEERLAAEKIYYDRATVLRQLGVFYEPDCAMGRITTVLTHPVTMAQIASRKFGGRPNRSIWPGAQPQKPPGPLVTLATCDRWVFCSL